MTKRIEDAVSKGACYHAYNSSYSNLITSKLTFKSRTHGGCVLEQLS